MRRKLKTKRPSLEVMSGQRDAGAGSATGCVSHISSHLISIATARQTANPNGAPPELAHNARQAPVGIGRPSALRRLQQVKDSLCRYPLQAIAPEFALQASEADRPRV